MLRSVFWSNQYIYSEVQRAQVARGMTVLIPSSDSHVMGGIGWCIEALHLPSNILGFGPFEP